MTKDEIKKAIQEALAEHQKCNEAVKESAIPAGMDVVFTAALTNALSARLGRIFDPKPVAAPLTDYEVVSANDLGTLETRAAKLVAQGYTPLGGVAVVAPVLNGDDVAPGYSQAFVR